ncbi:hypothetical protein NQ318_001367 [Aromia moschata]|uniref:Uncharacterized protein n=1 Tax=Aromia moschata TaxID=1265417 RepID=A0AAV8YWK1_9CUCU|nr:hypothetical protein NQ318_001367 [Aromia moschata]
MDISQYGNRMKTAIIARCDSRKWFRKHLIVPQRDNTGKHSCLPDLLENEDSSRSDSECSDSVTVIQHIFRWFRRYVYLYRKARVNPNYKFNRNIELSIEHRATVVRIRIEPP